ncbi:hypothetical protein ElyMa_003976400 [Elysia marginata]|uniref:Uncharacterized protein n=1 Tax=Elysia marginata TaxID=1093978 RepID=A0AAV4FYE8_9GAST|nr:hypothetical protein ElyMa_003976400 [Elysia marginata]
MANNATPFQSSAVRPIDPASAQAQKARYQQQSSSSSTSQSTSTATSLLGLPGSSSSTTSSSLADGSSTTAAATAADREVLRAMSLSRQSSLASLVDQNSRGAATDTPSVYSEEDEEDETDSDRSSPVDL